MKLFLWALALAVTITATRSVHLRSQVSLYSAEFAQCEYDESKRPSDINGKCSPVYFKDVQTGCQTHFTKANCEGNDGCCIWKQVTLAPTASPVVVPTSSPVSVPPTPAAWHDLFANNKNCREHCDHCLNGIGSGCCDCGNFVGCGGSVSYTHLTLPTICSV